MNAAQEGAIFVHLSDIHFRREVSGTVFDVDQDIRNELKNDAKTQIDKLEGITGILITGDIAFVGRTEASSPRADE